MSPSGSRWSRMVMRRKVTPIARGIAFARPPISSPRATRLEPVGQAGASHAATSPGTWMSCVTRIDRHRAAPRGDVADFVVTRRAAEWHCRARSDMLPPRCCKPRLDPGSRAFDEIQGLARG